MRISPQFQRVIQICLFNSFSKIEYNTLSRGSQYFLHERLFQTFLQGGTILRVLGVDRVFTAFETVGVFDLPNKFCNTLVFWQIWVNGYLPDVYQRFSNFLIHGGLLILETIGQLPAGVVIVLFTDNTGEAELAEIGGIIYFCLLGEGKRVNN